MTPDTPKTSGETAREYAQRMTRETGRPFIVSARGHAMGDFPDNRRLMQEELGGIVARYSKGRVR